MRLRARRVVLGLSGSIAAYKAAEIARLLMREGATVRVVMTDGAAKFITPLTFESLTGQPVYTAMFDQPRAWEMEHISWARWGEVIVVAPATANVLAKLANGISDDPLSTLCLAREPHVPLLVAPAMNTQMWRASPTQRNLEVLRHDGVTVIEPTSGDLACGEEGEGRLADPPDIVEAVVATLIAQCDLLGRRILIDAGPTREPLDAVRVLTNPSTGKMGFTIAEAAVRRGAEVTLVAGPSPLPTPPGVERVDVVTAEEMWRAMESRWESQDAIVFAAAVSDFRPSKPSAEKIRKGEAPREVALEPTPDIAASIGRLAGERSGSQRPVLVGFAAETGDLEAHGRAKCDAKGFDFVVANAVGPSDSGFGADTNRAVFVTQAGAGEPERLTTKAQLAEEILDRVAGLLAGRGVTSVQ